MTMKRTTALKLFTLLLSTSVLSLPSYGQEPVCQEGAQVTEGPVTLQETLERTYMQNATLDAARAGLRAQVETVSQAVADWRPSLSVRGTQGFGSTWNKTVTTPAPGPDNNRKSHAHSHETGYVATLSQNIYKGGATVANIGEQDNTFFSVKGDLFSTEQNVLFSAMKAHADIIALQDTVKYRQEAVAFYKTILQDAEARFEVGAAPRTDLETARAQYEDAQGDLSVALGDLESAKATYVKIVASSPENLAPPEIILPLPESYEEAHEVASTNNPSIKSARFKLEAAQYHVDVQFAELLPELNVQGTVGNDWDGRHTNSRINGAFGTEKVTSRETAVAATATLTVPIYMQGIPSSKVRQAYQLVAQQKVTLVQIRRDVEEATRTAWEKHLAAREALKGYLAAVKAGEIAVEGAKAEFELGAKSIVDVTVVQNQLITAQIELVAAQEAIITTAYGVLQAMGSLMAANLKLNVQYYDPDAYYNEYRDAWIQFWQGEDWRYVKDEPCGPPCVRP